jgi:alcohol dehydrogenase class IV
VTSIVVDPLVAVPNFVYRTVPQRIVFGAGTRHGLPGEVQLAGIDRAMVISTPEQASSANELAELLGDRCHLRFPGARMHTPVSITEEAVALAAQHGVNGLVSIGGGSAIGLAKAIALRTDIVQIVLPTTYAGSEMTDIVGQTAGGVKQTIRDPKILPEVVVYDVELTATLPAVASVTSGANAIAHAIEGLYAENSNPLIALIAEEGIRALGSALPRLSGRLKRAPTYVEAGSSRPLNTVDDMPARAEALYGAWLCATVLGATSMALHHKLCHVLGGTFDLPHAETHGVMLPHTIAYNAPAVPAAMTRAARALDADDVPARLFDLVRDGGAPVSLRALGLPREGLERATDLALLNPYWNPRPLERDGIRALLEDAWHGRRPGSTTA